MAEEIVREYYEHDALCPQKNFSPMERGMKRCDDCAGIFDATTGKGVALTSKKFDENWVDPDEQ